MTIQLAEKALETGTSVFMIYEEGSFPGKVREITPIKITKDTIIATCKLRMEERTFILNKMVFIEPEDIEAYDQAELPINISDTIHLSLLLKPFLNDKNKVNVSKYHIELTSLDTKSKLLELTYEEKSKSGFQKERPWRLTIAGKASGFKSFTKAANKFYDTFKCNYKASPTYQYELDYISSMEERWKPRSIAVRELICAVVKDENGNTKLNTDHWQYKVLYGHRECLNIYFLQRMVDKKPIMAWTQGVTLDFKTSTVFESTDDTSFIQISLGIEMCWDVESNSMFEGIVKFDVFKRRDGKIVRHASYSANQIEFLKILITGDLDKAELLHIF